MTWFDERFLLLFLTLATFTSVGLVAVWAALGRGHWFFRALVVVALIALPLLIASYELVVLFLVQSALTAIPLFFLRRYQRPAVPAFPQDPAPLQGRAQLHLRDLLLAMVIAAAISAILAQIPRATWSEARSLAMLGAAFGVLTLVGVWIGLGRSRLWLRLLALCLCFPATPVALLLNLVRMTRRTDRVTATFPWIRRLGVSAIVLLVLLIFGPPAFVFCKLYPPPTVPKPPSLPSPNGYENLAQAAKSFSTAAAPTNPEPVQALRTFVTQNRVVLDRAHSAFQQPCQVPLRYNWSDVDISGFSADARRVALAFSAEAMLARHEGRTSDGIRIAIDQFRLGEAVSRGRLMVHWMIGQAIDEMGISGLARLRETMTSQQCRELIRTLQRIESESESAQDVIARDQHWGDLVPGGPHRVVFLISRVAGNPAWLTVTQAFKSHLARMRLLRAELALCAYSREHGRLPEALAQLVPDYLPAVPEDPFTFAQKPLIYRRTSQGHLLYSVGLDGKDDGGDDFATTPYVSAMRDLFLDDPKPRKPSAESSDDSDSPS